MQARTAHVSKHNGHAPQASEADDPSEIESELLQEYNRAGRPPQRVRASTKCSAVIFLDDFNSLRCFTRVRALADQAEPSRRQGHREAGDQVEAAEEAGGEAEAGEQVLHETAGVCARVSVLYLVHGSSSSAAVPACMHACMR